MEQVCMVGGSWCWLEARGGGEMVEEGKYGTNTVYTCKLMEKWYLLTQFLEWGQQEMKEK
jgi:hypothetical protein